MTEKKCNCPVCENGAKREGFSEEHFKRIMITCPRCGMYKLPEELDEDIQEFIMMINDVKERNNKKFALSHFLAINVYKSIKKYFFFDRNILETIKLDLKQPNPAEQADNLIQYLGDNLKSLSDKVLFNADNRLKICAIIGTGDENDLKFILENLSQVEFIDKIKEVSDEYFWQANTEFRLTFKGWQRYEELKKVRKDSKQVFMAMQFGNTQLNDLFNNHLVKAVKQTGLDLKKLTDIPKDGIIDNHLRVEIRKSCLLIADLSDDNHGAYWEAGYAEGLGKPVIYLCEETKFKKESTHFDTSHLQTISWRTGNEEECVKKLKSLIRVVLPDNTKMEDE